MSLTDEPAPVALELTLTDDGPMWSASVRATDGLTFYGTGRTLIDAARELEGAVLRLGDVSIRMLSEGDDG